MLVKKFLKKEKEKKQNKTPKCQEYKLEIQERKYVSSMNITELSSPECSVFNY